MDQTISISRLKSLVHYNPETGLFTCVSARGPLKAGAILKSQRDDGYLRAKIDFRMYRLNRLAWFYMMGEWPDGFVDHINRDRTDNRWSNLRVLSHMENLQNREKPNSRNKSGLIGAHYLSSLGKWGSSISARRVSHRLGIFDTAQEAHKAYLAAKQELHPTFSGAIDAARAAKGTK